MSGNKGGGGGAMAGGGNPFDALNKIQSIVAKMFKRPDGDFADRLSCRYTVMMLSVFSMTLMMLTYWGTPLVCWAPAEYKTVGWHHFVNHFCYVHGTYFLPSYMDKNFPWDPREKKEVITYYQWVPYALAVQAIIFYLPRALWKVCSQSRGVNMALLTDRFSTLAKEASGTKFEKRLELFRTMAVPLFREHITLYNHRSWKFITLPMLYLVSKVFQATIAFFQLVWLIGWHDFALLPSWGSLSAVWDIYYGANWQETGHFPRMTYCDFRRGNPSSYQLETVMCVLSLNLYYEKIFMMLFVWLFVVFVFNVLSTIYWTITLCFPLHLYEKQIIKYVEAVEIDEKAGKSRDIAKALIKEYGRGGVFVLRQLSSNLGDLPIAYLTRAMAHHPSLKIEESGTKSIAEKVQLSYLLHKHNKQTYPWRG